MRIYNNKNNEKIISIAIGVLGILLLSTGVGLGIEEFEEPNIEGTVLDEEADLDILAEYPHCYEENNEWYCYQLSVGTFPMRFTEDIECFIPEDRLDRYQDSGNCYTTVEIYEETSINASLIKVISPSEYERVKREDDIEKGTEIEAIVSPDAIDYDKCTEPEFSEEESVIMKTNVTKDVIEELIDELEGIFNESEIREMYKDHEETETVIEEIHKTTCDYEGQEYTGEISYYGSDNFIAIHEMAIPEEEPFELPISLPVLILIILIIGAGIWVFYPKIQEKIKRIR